MQQLKLEKEFSDAALFSDFQGVILFTDKETEAARANTFIEDLCRSNGMTVEPAESFSFRR